MGFTRAISFHPSTFLVGNSRCIISFKFWEWDLIYRAEHSVSTFGLCARPKRHHGDAATSHNCVGGMGANDIASGTGPLHGHSEPRNFKVTLVSCHRYNDQTRGYRGSVVPHTRRKTILSSTVPNPYGPFPASFPYPVEWDVIMRSVVSPAR